MEAIDQVKDGDELLIIGETTGAYEMVAHDLHDNKGKVRSQIAKGAYFAVKTDHLIRRGDKLYIMQVVE